MAESAIELDKSVRSALKSQYHAALSMLRQTIERCPEDLWTHGQPPQFWQVAYHAAFYTHLYLMPDEKAFVRWEHTRDEYNFLGTLPWPPQRAPNIGEPYTKAQLLEYVNKVDVLIDPTVDVLDLTSSDCGFSWYQVPKLQHQIMNIRHLQHHTSILATKLRAATGQPINWIGPGR